MDDNGTRGTPSNSIISVTSIRAGMEDTLAQIEDEYEVAPADVLTVSDLNSHIGDKVDTDPDLADIYLLGEVSNLSESSSGHVFLDLKDEHSKVDCVIFSGTWNKMDYEMKDGDEVLVKGTAEYYQKNGSVSVKIRKVYPVGEGIYYKELRKRIKKLKQEGLFDEKHKQPIPDLPEKVGIVTSTEGAAVQDMVNSTHERFPEIDIYVKHAAVQGKHAVDDIVEGIAFFDEQFDVDVIIVGRGGGSIEDLQAFNTEDVARAIFNAETPIVSGVGHRTDETIAGYVADYGAITPTAAGKVITPRKAKLERDLEELEDNLRQAVKGFKTKKTQQNKLELALSREQKYKVALAASVLLNIWLLTRVFL